MLGGLSAEFDGLLLILFLWIRLFYERPVVLILKADFAPLIRTSLEVVLLDSILIYVSLLVSLVSRS